MTHGTDFIFSGRTLQPNPILHWKRQAQAGLCCIQCRIGPHGVRVYFLEVQEVLLGPTAVALASATFKPIAGKSSDKEAHGMEKLEPELHLFSSSSFSPFLSLLNGSHY